jgi:hypothetical protein
MNPNINVTNHARGRWTLRVNPNAGDNAEKEALKAYHQAEYIWQDKDSIDFYVDSNFVEYVCDPKKQSMITLFDIDFGFPEDINKQIAIELIKKVRLAKEVVDTTKQKQYEEREKNNTQIDKINLEIEKLKAEIAKKEAEKRRIENFNQELDAGLNVVVKEFENLAYQLTFSKNYKMEKLIDNKKVG